MTLRTRKLSSSLAVLAAILLAVAGVLDQFGQRYTEDSFNRALVTFGISRGLNAVISVAQGTELAMEPAGIGVIFTPGQVLDPVNDLVERFSWVMLASTTSLGVQTLLLKLFSSLTFTIILCLVLLASLLVIWWSGPVPLWVKALIFQLAIVLVILRFVIPVMAIANEALYKGFLEPEYTTSSGELEKAKDAIVVFNSRSTENSLQGEQPSWFESWRGRVDSVLESIDLERQLEALRVATEKLAEHTINLIVIFFVQTILFPLLFVWLVFRGSRFLRLLKPV